MRTKDLQKQAPNSRYLHKQQKHDQPEKSVMFDLIKNKTFCNKIQELTEHGS